MHAYLLTGNNQAAVENSLKAFIKKLKVNSLEFPLQKIEDVRALNSFTNLKIDKPTAIILKDFHLATVPAQNAFLKNLEEPQENLYYILTAASENLVLPTISSRSQLIRVSYLEETKNPESETAFLGLPSDKKLEIVDKIKKRDDAIDFTQNLLFACHYQLRKTQNNHLIFARFAKSVAQTRRRLKQNGNVTLQLTNLVVNLA